MKEWIKKGIVLAIAALLLGGAWQYRQQCMTEEIAGKVIRFHVRANSDTRADQDLKLKVRDAVGAYMQPRLAEIFPEKTGLYILDTFIFNPSLKGRCPLRTPAVLPGYTIGMNQWHNQDELLLIPVLTEQGNRPAVTGYGAVLNFEYCGILLLQTRRKTLFDFFLQPVLLHRGAYLSCDHLRFSGNRNRHYGRVFRFLFFPGIFLLSKSSQR